MGPRLLSMSGRLPEDILMQRGRTGVHRKGYSLTGIGDSDVVWGYVLP